MDLPENIEVDLELGVARIKLGRPVIIASQTTDVIVVHEPTVQQQLDARHAGANITDEDDRVLEQDVTFLASLCHASPGEMRALPRRYYDWVGMAASAFDSGLQRTRAPQS